MKKHSAELDVKIAENGDLLIPASVLKRLNVGHKGTVRVKLTEAALSGRLRRQRVTEEEVEQIMALQLEPRENVIKFLATESRLSDTPGFRRRAQELRGRS